MPGFSPTCTAAARASWFALPVTKLSNVNSRFSRARSRIEGTSPLPRRARGAGAAAGEARAPQRRHERVGGGEDQGVRIDRRLGGERADPGVELLRGEPSVD